MKPKLRLIHNLARSGSTLMSKCIGCMKDVVLLSEIHPLAMNQFNPLAQANNWFHLLTQADIHTINNNPKGGLEFVDCIKMIEERCRDNGKVLVIRDWAHLDYTLPLLGEQGTCQPGLYNALKSDFDILQFSTTRDPIDQWLSVSRLQVMHDYLKNGSITIESYMNGYLKFSQLCEKTGYIKYEDFTSNPHEEIKKLCGKLEIPFDETFIDRWHKYTTISGDTVSTRGGNEIKKLTRRPINENILKQIQKSDAYLQAINLMSYSPPQNEI